MSVPTTRSLSQMWRSRAHWGSNWALPKLKESMAQPLSFSPTATANDGNEGTGGELGREQLVRGARGARGAVGGEVALEVGRGEAALEEAGVLGNVGVHVGGGGTC
eukprot:7279277-Alexandrium_andersonii.AAC.1